MRGKNKPFVLYWRGPMSFIIVPRGRMGWFQFVAWLALMAAWIAWFVTHAREQEAGPDFGAGLVLFLIGVVIWAGLGLWWMLARAEVIDVVVLTRDKQRRMRKQRRRQQQDSTEQP
jgi:hypothetical protein